MATYRQGTLVLVQAEFYSAPPPPGGDGVLTDPTSISLSYTAPDGEHGPFVPTRVSVGLYTYQIDTTAFAGGSVTYKFTGTGACQAVGLNSFKIAGNPF
ncbi:MAG TPA: hypothetical protein VMW80_14300 [Candidatus Dormibacteraeota bacterium]|nr:hypothetical protein [Candidatus Dormibacteraeota bacterium]